MAVAGFNPGATRRATLHGRIVPLGAGLLIAAFVTDLLYLRTVSDQWETFSVWLITGGLIVAGLSGLAFLLDLAVGRMPVSWPRFLLFAGVVALSTVNAFVHSRDGYTAVAPSGVLLSGVVTLLLLAAAVGGWSLDAPAARPPSR